MSSKKKGEQRWIKPSQLPGNTMKNNSGKTKSVGNPNSILKSVGNKQGNQSSNIANKISYIIKKGLHGTPKQRTTEYKPKKNALIEYNKRGMTQKAK